MKKTFSLLTALIVMLSTTACSDNPPLGDEIRTVSSPESISGQFNSNGHNNSTVKEQQMTTSESSEFTSNITKPVLEQPDERNQNNSSAVEKQTTALENFEPPSNIAEPETSTEPSVKQSDASEQNNSSATEKQTTALENSEPPSNIAEPETSTKPSLEQSGASEQNNSSADEKLKNNLETSQNSSSETEPEAPAEIAPVHSEIKEEDTLNIAIVIDSKTFSATLYNNETVKALIKQFPMTLNMNELNGNEKYYNLDNSLPTNSSRPSGIQTGDIMLFGSDCLVLFYESFSTAYSYTPLGRINDPDGLASALGSGNVQVSFSIV